MKNQLVENAWKKVLGCPQSSPSDHTNYFSKFLDPSFQDRLITLGKLGYRPAYSYMYAQWRSLPNSPFSPKLFNSFANAALQSRNFQSYSLIEKIHNIWPDDSSIKLIMAQGAVFWPHWAQNIKILIKDADKNVRLAAMLSAWRMGLKSSEIRDLNPYIASSSEDKLVVFAINSMQSPQYWWPWNYIQNEIKNSISPNDFLSNASTKPYRHEFDQIWENSLMFQYAIAAKINRGVFSLNEAIYKGYITNIFPIDLISTADKSAIDSAVYLIWHGKLEETSSLGLNYQLLSLWAANLKAPEVETLLKEIYNLCKYSKDLKKQRPKIFSCILGLELNVTMPPKKFLEMPPSTWEEPWHQAASYLFATRRETGISSGGLKEQRWRTVIS